MSSSFKDLKGPTTIPLIGNLHQIKFNDLHIQIEKWTEEYGPIFRIKLGPVKITIMTDPEMIQAVLRKRPEGFRRIQKIDDVFSGIGMKGVFNAEGEEWYKHRALIAKGLDLKHQQAYFPSILNSTKRLLNKWKGVSEGSEPYNIQHDFLRFTVDVTTTLAFGRDLNTLEQQGEIIQDHLEKIFPMLFKRISSPIPLWKYYKTKTDREFDHSLSEIENFIAEVIADGRQRIANDPVLETVPTNILEALIVASKQDEVITDREIKGNLLTVLVAGVDTSTYTLAWIIYHLCKYPALQDKIREEANLILGKEEHITVYEQLSSLPYTDALTYESMRLKTVSPMLLHEANEDVFIKDYEVKKGEIVLIESRYACKHMDHFVNPLEFDIERWINKAPNRSEKGHDLQAYIPFGSGPRFCPGRNLAQLELRMVLSMLVKNFKIEMITKEEDVKELRTFTVMPSLFYVKLTKV